MHRASSRDGGAVVDHPAVRIAGTALVFCAIVVFVYQFSNALIDDAFIQLKYAENVAHHGMWGFFADRVTNTATSPLNVILTALVALIAPSMISAVVWLTAVEFLLVFACVWQTGLTLFKTPYFGIVAFVGLVANPLLLSTIGLEGTLFALGIAASVWFFVSCRWLLTATSLALLTLTRADGTLLFLLFLLVVPGIRTRARFVLVYALVLAPWHMYSWIHLGSFIPDTMKIKMFQRAWSAWMTFPHGPALYFQVFPLASAFSIVLLPFGLLCLASKDRRVQTVAAVLAAYAALHFAAYSTIQVPPYHWYYVSQVVPSVLVGALGLSVLFERLPSARAVRIAVMASALLPAAGLTAIAYRDGFRVDEMPIHTNWASHETYKQLGLWIKEHTEPSATIFCAAEIGTLAFYSERLLINEFSDFNRVSEAVVSGAYYDKPVIGPLMRVNYYWRQLQTPFAFPRYRLDAAIGEARGGPIPPETVKTWEVSSKWIEWRTPGKNVQYRLRTSSGQTWDGTR